MSLWTDVIDPATLTGYVRAYIEDYEAQQGSLARWLPNRYVPDTVVRFVQNDNGLVPIAEFRAYDAEPTIGSLPGGKRITLELPALGRNIPASEYNQLRARNANISDERALPTLENAGRVAGRAVVGAIELLRGTTIDSGRATVPGFMDDDFGRSPQSAFTAAEILSDPDADLLGMAQDWSDGYNDRNNGEDTGAVVVSPKILRNMAKLRQFATVLASGGNRPATQADARTTWEAAGLPTIYVYNRKVNRGGVTTRVLDQDKMYFLPSPVDPNEEEGGPLGATHWGQTLTSSDPAWGIGDAEQPGLVVGVYRNPKPPMIAETISDAIALPTLANPDLAMAVKVL